MVRMDTTSRGHGAFSLALSPFRVTAALGILGRFRPGNDPVAVRERRVPSRNFLDSHKVV